jgi:long-chain-fatty-acid--CoA ligase ACSBG
MNTFCSIKMKFKNIHNGQAEQKNPITVTDLMRQTAENYPNHTALMYKDKLSNDWRSISFKEYRERVEYTAKVFIKLGLEKNGAVAVLASNSAEWFISELAAIHAGYDV